MHFAYPICEILGRKDFHGYPFFRPLCCWQILHCLAPFQGLDFLSPFEVPTCSILVRGPHARNGLLVLPAMTRITWPGGGGLQRLARRQ